MTPSEHKAEARAKMTAKYGKPITGCVSACLEALGITGYNVACTPHDIVRLARRAGYHVRSRNSKFGIRTKRVTVGALRRRIDKSDEQGLFLAHVEGHALLLGNEGQTLVDTAPRLRDRRQVHNLWTIYR